MTKEEAREMLEKWINHKTKHKEMTLPIVDEVVLSKIERQYKDTEIKEPGVWPSGELSFEQYTFKYLIKIAYDLKDNG